MYSQAQTVLLSELGLVDWQPRHSLAFVKNYADIQQSRAQSTQNTFSPGTMTCSDKSEPIPQDGLL